MHESVNGLQIKVPTPIRHIMSMADAMPELRSATADFTDFCHKDTLILSPAEHVKMSIAGSVTGLRLAQQRDHIIDCYDADELAAFFVIDHR